jgi:putative oxidoreductase
MSAPGAVSQQQPSAKSPAAEAAPAASAASVAASAEHGWLQKAATLLKWGLAVEFGGAGGAKLMGLPAMVALFAAVGFGQWFRYATGIWEITGAILLVLPRTATLGALALSALMLGAAGSEMLILHRAPISSLGTLVLLLVLLWSRARR